MMGADFIREESIAIHEIDIIDNRLPRCNELFLSADGNRVLRATIDYRYIPKRIVVRRPKNVR